MSDDLTKRGGQDATHINVNEKWELEYWTKKFGITADELKAAVRAVGTSVPKVTEYLKK